MNLRNQKFSALIFCGLSLVTAATLARGQGALLPIEPMPSAVATPDAATQTAINELEYLRRAAGMTALRGPGVIVTLRDRKGAGSKDASQPIAGLVHDYDLTLIVNQLRAVEAEAIAINGVRIGSQTSITVIGSSIVVGEQRINNPFKIEAIGDAGRMKNKLAAPETINAFKNGGPQLSVITSKNVRIAPLKQSPEFRFAKPA